MISKKDADSLELVIRHMIHNVTNLSMNSAITLSGDIMKVMSDRGLIEPPPREPGWYWCHVFAYNARGGNVYVRAALEWKNSVWYSLNGLTIISPDKVIPTDIKLPAPPPATTCPT